MTERKKHLTPEEKLRVAYAHFCLGHTQEDLATIMGVNQGRINEACKAVGALVGLTKPSKSPR